MTGKITTFQFHFDDKGNFQGIQEVGRQCADLVQLPTVEDYERVVKEHFGKYKGCMEIGITFTNGMLNTYRKSHLQSMIEKRLKRCHNIIMYRLIPELSEIGRFHYHGYILFKNLKKVDNFRRRMSIIFGRTEVKYISNEQAYMNYILKSKDVKFMAKYQIVKY